MDNLISFLIAFLTQWIALMSGVVSLILTLILRARGWNPSNKIFYYIAVGVLLIASFLAWRDEHTLFGNAQKQIEQIKQDSEQQIAQARQELDQERARNIPKLSCGIKELVVGEGADTKYSQVFIKLSVSNVGAIQSVATNYKLQIKSLDLNAILLAADIPSGYALTLADNSQKLVFSGKNSLAEITKEPIGPGAQKEGWLRFDTTPKEEMPVMPPSYFLRPGITYTVSVEDIVGKVCSAEHVTQNGAQNQAVR